MARPPDLAARPVLPTVLPTGLLALALVLGLAGCRLVDQTTFNADAGKPPVIPARPQAAVPAAAGQAALLRIPLSPEPDWAAPLRQSVLAARQRKPTVEFDVVAVVPATGAQDAQVAAVGAAGEPAARVAQSIQAAGIAAARVHLLARPEPGAERSEIRVFVR